MGFFINWIVFVITAQVCLHAVRYNTTEATYAFISRLIDLTYLQAGMVLGSWFYLNKRLNSFCLKVDPCIRKWLKGAFIVVATAAHLAYIFFYIDLPENPWIIHLCFFAVAFYIHLIILTLVFYAIEQVMKRILPEEYSRSLFTSSTFYTLIALILAILLTSYSVAVTRDVPTVQAVDIKIKDLPKGFDGFSIALLTDLHIGPTIGKQRVEDIVKIVNSLGVDSIAISGDLVDGFLDNIRHKAIPLENLNSKHGVFYSTGNHEYYHGDINPLMTFFKDELNLTVLHNENAVVQRGKDFICFAGVDDLKSNVLAYKGHKMDAEKALAGCPNESTVVLLVHQPNAAGKILKSTKRKIDLILSGHTHSGQLYVVFPVAYMLNTFFHGLYRDVQTNAQIYVSAGVNFWGPPVKMANLCEIILLRLHPEK